MNEKKQVQPTDWQKGNIVEPIVFRATVFTGKNYVGVGDGGKVAVGDSPLTMKFVPTGLNENQHIFAVCTGKDAGTVLGMGRDGVGISSDDHGSTWKSINIGQKPPARTDGTMPDIYGVTWTSSQYVAIWETGGISTSPDAIKWTFNSNPVGSLRCVDFIRGQVMIGTANGYLISSSDLVNWKKVRVDAGGIRAIAYSEKHKMLVVVGHNVSISTDTAFNRWQTTYHRPAGDENVLMSAAAVGDKIYAAGDSGKCLLSSDGLTWTPGETDSMKHWLGFAQSPKYLVSVGNGGPKNNNPKYTHSVHYLSIDGNAGGGGSGPGDGGGDDGGGGDGGGGDGGGAGEPGSDVQQMLREAIKKHQEVGVLLQNALALVTTGRDESKPARKKK